MNIQQHLKKPLFKRDYVDAILKWLPDKEMIVLTGPRQSGKTSLLLYIIKHLLENKIAAETDILFYDAEDPSISDLFSSGIENVKKELMIDSAKTKQYLFIDEVHYIKDAGRLLKYLVDHHGDRLKIFISGSSSLGLSEAFKESMTGRKIVFEILPLNFGEFLEFKGSNSLRFAIRPTETKQARVLFEEFCMYGGYPRIAVENDTAKKMEILKEIYSSYIRKDISSFFGAESHERFNNLVKYTAINSGQIFNINSACKALGAISRSTLERYLSVLEGTYVIKKVTPFHGNKTKEIIKMPKYYFIDNGLRNAVLNSFNPLEIRTDAGCVLETAALRQLTVQYPGRDEIKFYRTKNGLEIDFISDTQAIRAYEIKKNGENFAQNSVSDFIAKYKPADFTVLNLSKTGTSGGFKYEYLYEFNKTPE